MIKPLVAIVGKPNVGKSTFFNKVIGKKLSIVEDKPGVTRDRVYYDAEWCGYNFTMIDTGGLELRSQDEMWKHIRAQAEIAIDIAQVIVFFVDAKQGLTSDDYAVAEVLRKSKKPIVLAVNKIDNNEVEETYDFYKLNIGEPFALSAEHGKGVGDLLDEIVAKLPKVGQDPGADSIIHIAVVGKPNAGKSSTVNRLLGYDRVIVSDIAGTTRDAIDTEMEYRGQRFNIIDTAGMRKKANVDEDVEYYSVVRALAAVRRADVVLIVIDATEEITEQDVKICGYCHEQGKPSIIIMNKWDAVEKDTHTMNKFNLQLDTELKFMSYYTSLYVSALNGQRIDKILDKVVEVFDNCSNRIPTGVLNDVVQDAIAVNEPPSPSGRRMKIFYATQVSTNPPTFVFFVNDSTLLHFSYLRYLENSLRKAFNFEGTPIHMIVRNRSDENK